MSKAHVANATGNTERGTPPAIVALAREVMGRIDLDPASHYVHQRTIQAANYYALPERDGLCLPWFGRVFMNPPYARGIIEGWVHRMCLMVESGRVKQAITVTNNATETQWGQRLLGASKMVCFPEGRICFLDENGVVMDSPLQGQMICGLGNELNMAKFHRTFARIGLVFLQ